jgi:2-polyprenyl-6-methoxyphenol hydroxylase-like FAD-dependent oxidoreductase
MKQTNFKITIVGGGPVGLFLGICLTKTGLDCTVLEQREYPVSDSRSLGIHPVSLKLFEKIDLASKFLKQGICIKKGIAHDGNTELGSINFHQLEEPYNFILACPQFSTETILRDRFLEHNPDGLITNALVTNISQSEKEAICYYQKEGQRYSLSSNFIVGCDGKKSLVRNQSGISFIGKKYPDTYIMGDFEDNTQFHNNAVVFLPKEGLIESFPLPDKMRRWVVKTDSFIKHPNKDLISEIVEQRTGISLSNAESTMMSSFGVQNYEAETFYKNRILLCGDAAHVVSPIGGQGMNLGWIGAYHLAKVLGAVRSDPESFKKLLSEFQIRQKGIVKKAARRAEWNMKLGRKQRVPILKKVLVKTLLTPPFNKIAAQKFAMKGLD